MKLHFMCIGVRT